MGFFLTLGGREPGSSSNTDLLLPCDKTELPEEVFFFFYNCGNEKVNMTWTALVVRFQLFVVVCAFFLFLSIGLGAGSLKEPYNMKKPGEVLLANKKN